MYRFLHRINRLRTQISSCIVFSCFRITPEYIYIDYIIADIAYLHISQIINQWSIFRKSDLLRVLLIYFRPLFIFVNPFVYHPSLHHHVLVLLPATGCRVTPHSTSQSIRVYCYCRNYLFISISLLLSEMNPRYDYHLAVI